jgi:molybdopterin converting factor small subunit
MATKILIPTPLRPYAEKRDAVQLEGSTIRELLQQLAEQYPQLKKHLYNEQGTLRSFVNIYVNDDDIRYLKNEETPVSERDVVSIVPSIAGGKHDES